MAHDGLSNGVAARHVIGRLLDLLHISWQTCAAHQLSDHGASVQLMSRIVLGALGIRSVV
jgi:hypothetical protein